MSQKKNNIADRKQILQQLLKNAQLAATPEDSPTPQHFKDEASKIFEQIAEQAATEIANQIDAIFEKELAS